MEKTCTPNSFYFVKSAAIDMKFRKGYRINHDVMDPISYISLTVAVTSLCKGLVLVECELCQW